jgi:hypothetical protein
MEENMDYIEMKMAPWSTKFGLVRFTGSDNLQARSLFKDYFGKSFNLETFAGTFNDVHFTEKTSASYVSLSCSAFFKKLSPKDKFFVSAKDDKTILITKTEPQDNINPKNTPQSKLTETELLELVATLTTENHQLRKENSDLYKDKDRLEKYESLQKIFDDEAFMEDWLERNIHRAIPDLEILERQFTITWPDSKKHRIDLLCLDKTTRELVIVENKVRGRNKTLDVQALTYSAWFKTHLDQINEKYKAQNLKATENLKVVIITDTIDDSVEIMCRETHIPLILIDGGVIFEEIVPYNE